jgi:hypothetical protein
MRERTTKDKTDGLLGSAAGKSGDGSTPVATWKPITEAPERSNAASPVEVLVWGKGLGVRTGRVARYQDGYIFAGVSNVSGNIAGDLVTHWMPLPAPPMAEATKGEVSNG